MSVFVPKPLPKGDTDSTVAVLEEAHQSIFNEFQAKAPLQETVHDLSGASVELDPFYGTIQLHTLTANTSYTENFRNGESITLQIDDGTGFVVSSWPSGMKWTTGSAPTLATTGSNVLVLWKAGNQFYGHFVGTAS